MAHIVSKSQPPNGALGDEWFNPTTNKLSKLVALSGTTVSWQDVGNVISGTSGGGTNIVTNFNTLPSNVEYTWTAKQTYLGNPFTTAVKYYNSVEQISTSGISPGSTGNSTVQVDFANSSIYYFNTNATNNWTINFRMSSATFLNNVMANNESISAVVMVTQGSTPYFSNATQIDGVTVIPKWQDALAPTSGNASSVDIYNYTIIKTANATYTVLGSQSRFA